MHAISSKKIEQYGRGHTFISELEEPFLVKRTFFITGVDPDNIRGKHANKHTNQILICIAGSVKISVTGPEGKSSTINLNIGDRFHLPFLHYVEMKFFDPSAILMVLADTPYNSKEYINGYDEYLEKVINKRVK